MRGYQSRAISFGVPIERGRLHCQAGGRPLCLDLVKASKLQTAPLGNAIHIPRVDRESPARHSHSTRAEPYHRNESMVDMKTAMKLVMDSDRIRINSLVEGIPDTRFEQDDKS